LHNYNILIYEQTLMCYASKTQLKLAKQTYQEVHQKNETCQKINWTEPR